MHPNNPLIGRYDFNQLKNISPNLKRYVIQNKKGDDTINFDDLKSVRELNKALLHYFYEIKSWDFPEKFLCPPIPSRADYLYYIQDLVDKKKQIQGLDIGVGANCIYPILGNKAFGWNFVGSDVNLESIKSAESIIEKNRLQSSIEIRLQKKNQSIFDSIIQINEKFDFSICNPPFHENEMEAIAGNRKKRKNLGLKRSDKLNFSGVKNELICEGGEKAFITQMIRESLDYCNQIKWFTTLVSKESNLHILKKILHQSKPFETKIIPMKHGQKKTRILAWTYQK